MLDLSKFKNDRAESGEWMDILSPVDGKPTGGRLLLAGTDSSKYRDVQRKIGNRRFRKWGKSAPKLTAEEIDSEGLDLLSACVLDWQGIFDGKEDVPFNEQNVRGLLEDFPWIREQVNEFIGDRTNFFSQ